MSYRAGAEKACHSFIYNDVSFMYLNKTILILEDNLKILSKLLEKFYDLENNQPFQLSVIVLTNYLQVENYVTTNPKAQFDIILLDRDCKLGGSFHDLDLNRFGPEKVISISAVPEYNQAAKARGVKKLVLKDQNHAEEFAIRVVKEVEKMLTPSRLLRFRTKLDKRRVR